MLISKVYSSILNQNYGAAAKVGTKQLGMIDNRCTGKNAVL